LNLAETIEDYADLLVLASCDYVLGSQQSSFSDLAIALNGSSQSTQIECLPTGRLTADEQRQRMMDRLCAVARLSAPDTPGRRTPDRHWPRGTQTATGPAPLI
jgi:hypothetical protein